MAGYYYNHIYQDLIGISSGLGSPGILYEENENHVKGWLIDSFGYNKSTTPSDGFFPHSGIFSYYGNLENCTGKSLLGNGIGGKKMIAKNCIGVAGGTTAGSPFEFFSFFLQSGGYLINSSSQVGSNNSYPLYLDSDQVPNGRRVSTYISNCTLNSKNNYCIKVNQTPAIPYTSIKIEGSSLGCTTASTGFGIINLPIGSTCIMHINNCQIVSRNSILVGPYSTINNNSIVIGSNANYAITGTFGGGNNISYSNNNIRGATSTGGGVNNITQQISSNVDTKGNINYVSLSPYLYYSV